MMPTHPLSEQPNSLAEAAVSQEPQPTEVSDLSDAELEKVAGGDVKNGVNLNHNQNAAGL